MLGPRRALLFPDAPIAANTALHLLMMTQISLCQGNDCDGGLQEPVAAKSHRMFGTLDTVQLHLTAQAVSLFEVQWVISAPSYEKIC